jgi:BirA family biotin operon repressor/biotin-[acetyl-CoA-carboxylase] ligase
MDEVWARAEREDEGFLLIAEEQTGGRGRFQRRWVAPAGTSLLFSVLLRPPLARAALIPVVLALAAAEGIEAATGLGVALKWPNDLLVAGRKTGGILVESRLDGSRVTIVGGIGINVNLDPRTVPGIPPSATSLSRAAGLPIERRALLAVLLERLDARYDDLLAGGDLIPAWRSRLVTLGKQVEVRHGNQMVRGRAVDVDRSGRLVVQLPGGALEVLAAGEVTLQR